MADASSSGQGYGAMGTEVGRNSIPDTDSMTAFLASTDLMSHMFSFILEKEDKESATLVSKVWRELSHSFPTWRKAKFRVKIEKKVKKKKGLLLERVRRHGLSPSWEASVSTIVDMLTHRKHITQYNLYIGNCRTKWWVKLRTFMPHLTWLSLSVRWDKKIETPFALKGLPNLTYLRLGGAYAPTYKPFGEYMLSSVSLRLPALQTLVMDNHMDYEGAKEVRRLEIECPSLVSARVTIHAELSISTSWFSNLQFLDLTLHNVPEVMKRSANDQEWVLDTCPQLVTLKVYIVCLRYEFDENDDDHDGIIRSITLDLPSLETLYLDGAHTAKKCTLTCPKLVDLELVDCWRMVTLNFDGGAQLRNFDMGGAPLLEDGYWGILEETLYARQSALRNGD